MIIFVSFERNNQHIFSFFFRHNDDNYQTLEVTTWNYTKVQVYFQYISIYKSTIFEKANFTRLYTSIDLF